MHQGYIKLFRSLKQSAFYRDSEYVHLWVHLLMSVNRTEKRLKIEKTNRFITLLPGQVLTSRKALVEQTGINRSKVERILKAFESEQQIEQQAFTKYRVISIVNWQQYQCNEHQSEQQTSSKRAADEQQMSTNKKEREGREGNKKEETTAVAASAKTKTELAFLSVFEAKETRIRELYPNHNFEAEREMCIHHYRDNAAASLDPYNLILKWFQRSQTSAIWPREKHDNLAFLREVQAG